LAAKKAAGASMGNQKNLAVAGAIGRAASIASADQLAKNLAPVLAAVRSEGALTLRSIAAAAESTRHLAGPCSP
jgi:hypothetical protein